MFGPASGVSRRLVRVFVPRCSTPPILTPILKKSRFRPAALFLARNWITYCARFWRPSAPRRGAPDGLHGVAPRPAISVPGGSALWHFALRVPVPVGRPGARRVPALRGGVPASIRVGRGSVPPRSGGGRALQYVHAGAGLWHVEGRLGGGLPPMQYAARAVPAAPVLPPCLIWRPAVRTSAAGFSIDSLPFRGRVVLTCSWRRVVGSDFGNFLG